MRRLVFAVVALSLWCAPSVLTNAPTPSALIESVERIGMTVSDLERSVAFFSNVNPLTLSMFLRIRNTPWTAVSHRGRAVIAQGLLCRS